MNDDRMTDDRVPLSLVVNGAPHVYCVRMHDSLLDVLRREGWTGAKRVCETADCGACSVLVDGTLVDSCSTLAFQAEGCKVDTVESLAGRTLHPLQHAFVQHAAVQCGYCIPGMLLSMKAVLDRDPAASDAELRDVMTLCRCTGYVKPLAATREYQDQLASRNADA